MYYRARSLHLPLQYPWLRHRLGASKSSRQAPPRLVALSSRRISTVRQSASSPAQLADDFFDGCRGPKQEPRFLRYKALAHNYNLPPERSRSYLQNYHQHVLPVASHLGLGSDCPLRTARNSHREDNASGRATFLAEESPEKLDPRISDNADSAYRDSRQHRLFPDQLRSRFASELAPISRSLRALPDLALEPASAR